ncbi:MAG: tetratricopeptide repeat protein [Ferruginibacter sp.]
MKILILLFCFITSVPAFAQNNNAGDGKADLLRYTNPMERFGETIKYLEAIDSYAGSNIDSAICIDLLQIAQQLNNDSLLAISYNWVGYYFSQSKGDNTAALEYYFKALPLAEIFNDKRRISSLYFDIAAIYYYVKNIDAFFMFTKKGGENLPAKTSPKYDYMLVQYQRNMGIAYMEKNDWDSALNYAQAAVQTSERLKLPTYRLQTLHLLGTVNSKMNENDLANVYFNKALILSDSVKSEIRKMQFFQRYIPFLFKNNRIMEAKVQADKFWRLSGNTQNLNFKLIATGYKKELFDKLNNTDSAYYYSKAESQLREQIFNQNNLNTIQGLAFKEQLRIIEDTANKSEQEEQRKQNIQYALIAIGIIVLLILFLLLSRSFITNTKLIGFFGVIALLIVFEFLNLLLHPTLERITHHSPLLMLLGLVCIAALLVPLHHKVEKWTTAKLVEKNKAIRLAAAKKTIEQLEKEDSN